MKPSLSRAGSESLNEMLYKPKARPSSPTRNRQESTIIDSNFVSTYHPLRVNNAPQRASSPTRPLSPTRSLSDRFSTSELKSTLADAKTAVKSKARDVNKSIKESATVLKTKLDQLTPHLAKVTNYSKEKTKDIISRVETLRHKRRLSNPELDSSGSLSSLSQPIRKLKGWKPLIHMPHIPRLKSFSKDRESITKERELSVNEYKDPKDIKREELTKLALQAQKEGKWVPTTLDRKEENTEEIEHNKINKTLDPKLSIAPSPIKDTKDPELSICSGSPKDFIPLSIERGTTPKLPSLDKKERVNTTDKSERPLFLAAGNKNRIYQSSSYSMDINPSNTMPTRPSSPEPTLPSLDITSTTNASPNLVFQLSPTGELKKTPQKIHLPPPVDVIKPSKSPESPQSPNTIKKKGLSECHIYEEPEYKPIKIEQKKKTSKSKDMKVVTKSTEKDKEKTINVSKTDLALPKGKQQYSVDDVDLQLFNQVANKKQDHIEWLEFVYRGDFKEKESKDMERERKLKLTLKNKEKEKKIINKDSKELTNSKIFFSRPKSGSKIIYDSHSVSTTQIHTPYNTKFDDDRLLTKDEIHKLVTKKKYQSPQ